MEMKNPPWPGRLLTDEIDELGLNVAKAAKAMGVTRQALYNVMNGKTGITADMAVRLEMAFGGTADHWLRMQAYYDLAQVRKRKPKLKIKRFELQSI